METRAQFLSCSSPPAVYPSPTEDRLYGEPVFMQIALNDGYRRTKHMSTSQSLCASYHAKEDTLCAQKPSHNFADESCCVHGKCSLGDFQSILHGRQVSYFETMLRRSNCVGCNINYQPGKTLLGCGILKLSTNMWHQGRGTVNVRLRLLQKNNTTVTGGSSSALAPESSCDFYSFTSILLLFQRTGYVESLTKGGKLTMTCSSI